MRTLTNGLVISQSDFKRFTSFKKELLNNKFNNIKRTIELFENHNGSVQELKFQNTFEKDELELGTGICFYKEPGETAPIDLENQPGYNSKAVSMFNNEVELLKTFSDYNFQNQELNLACMSGQYETILYPNKSESAFGISYNETCGAFEDLVSIPEGINIPENSLMNFNVRFKLDQQIDSAVCKLVPGNSGFRLHDLVGVIGTVYLEVSYPHSETNQIIKAHSHYTFLNKFQSSGTPVFGFYEDIVTTSISIPIKFSFGIVPQLRVTSIVNVNTFTGKNFLPGEVLQSGKQYSLIDFRKLGETSPIVTPESSKDGAGGIHLKWYKLCFPSATE